MNMLNKLITGGTSNRRSRLYTETGLRVSTQNMLDAPQAILGWMLKKSVNYRSARPWIPLPAIRKLAHLISPSWNVLEFGCGTSTIWFSAKAGSVTSVEHNPEWHNYTNQRIQSSGCQNVTLLLRPETEYVPNPVELPHADFDLIVIDGIQRDRCADLATQLVKPGGYIYLDNCDQESTRTEGGMPHAVSRTLSICTDPDQDAQILIGFPPTELFVTAGLLARKTTPRNKRSTDD